MKSDRLKYFTFVEFLNPPEKLLKLVTKMNENQMMMVDVIEQVSMMAFVV